MINACQILIILVENVILVFKSTPAKDGKEKFNFSVAAVNLLKPSHRHAFEDRRKENTLVTSHSNRKWSVK